MYIRIIYIYKTWLISSRRKKGSMGFEALFRELGGSSLVFNSFFFFSNEYPPNLITERFVGGRIVRKIER